MYKFYLRSDIRLRFLYGLKFGMCITNVGIPLSVKL